jgi:hypothetical protein
MTGAVRRSLRGNFVRLPNIHGPPLARDDPFASCRLAKENEMSRSILILGAALIIAVPASAQLANPGFQSDDASGGDVGGAVGWGSFTNVFTVAAIARSGAPCS